MRKKTRHQRENNVIIKSKCKFKINFFPSYEVMSVIQLLEMQNSYSDWVSFNLNGVADPSEKSFSLSLILNCQEQWRSHFGGRVKLGLKTGMFKLKLNSGEFLAQAAPENCLTCLNTQEFCWQIFPAQGQSLLDYNNQEIFLGKLTLKKQTCNLKTTFEIIPADLSITDAEGLWRYDLSPNKHGILERVLARFFVQHYFTPQVMAAQFAIADSIIAPEPILVKSPEPSLDLLTNLQNLIEQIYQADLQDLTELAKIADLNLKIDLAGGNFLGAILNGVELSGANLSRSNFRGAILTDADLSEANLSDVNFRGADLSGAYLESANLRNADFQKSSLALATLISTDLSHANLQDTTVTNANFSGANVSQALFGNNPGMTNAMKESLQARGANFIRDRD